MSEIKLESVPLKLWLPESKQVAEILQWFDTEHTKLAMHYSENERRIPWLSEENTRLRDALKQVDEHLEPCTGLGGIRTIIAEALSLDNLTPGAEKK